jgi:hypothetical protein
MDTRVSPWAIDQLPDEANREDVDAARKALGDGDEPVSVPALAALVDRSTRTVQRWRSEGCRGMTAKMIHVIRLLDGQEIRE